MTPLFTTTAVVFRRTECSEPRTWPRNDRTWSTSLEGVLPDGRPPVDAVSEYDCFGEEWRRDNHNGHVIVAVTRTAVGLLVMTVAVLVAQDQPQAGGHVQVVR